MPEQSIVLELQALSTDRSQSITNLLRKALLVATKLNLNEFKSWINNELHGYNSDNVPVYRKVKAELKAINPFHGYIPYIINNSEIMEILENVSVMDPIGSLEDLMRDDSQDKGILIVPLPLKATKMLLDWQEGFGKLQPVRTVSRNSIANILESVRTVILEWALKLEAEGIVGESLTFSNVEKEKAQDNPQINIQNFQGILGDVINSNVTQNLKMKIDKGNFENLSNYLSSFGIKTDEINDLKLAIESDPIPKSRESFGSNVSEWMGKTISKAASGALKIGLGAASNLLANAIWAYYGL